MQTVSGSQWRKRLSRRTVVKFPFAALSAKAQPSTSVCRNQTANNCARNRARYRWQLKSAITSPNFALWCNGNTAPFGGVILGSNPSGAATPAAWREALAVEKGVCAPRFWVGLTTQKNVIFLIDRYSQNI